MVYLALDRCETIIQHFKCLTDAMAFRPWKPSHLNGEDWLDGDLRLVKFNLVCPCFALLIKDQNGRFTFGELHQTYRAAKAACIDIAEPVGSIIFNKNKMILIEQPGCETLVYGKIIKLT